MTKFFIVLPSDISETYKAGQKMTLQNHQFTIEAIDTIPKKTVFEHTRKQLYPMLTHKPYCYDYEVYDHTPNVNPDDVVTVLTCKKGRKLSAVSKNN